MARLATKLTVLFPPGQLRWGPESVAETLADHLVGQTLQPGAPLALPGWPVATVETIEPAGATVGPGTELEILVPPTSEPGGLNVAFLVDASLTMRQGDETTRYENAAHTLDGILLSGRGFLSTAGTVVQGGTTRHVEPLASPEACSGASILKVQPRGTFELDAGLKASLELVAEAPAGPRAVLIVTDGQQAPKDLDACTRLAVHAGTTVIALAPDPPTELTQLCQATGGACYSTPERAFEHLATLAGAQAIWQPAPPPGQTNGQDPDEFEAVIERVEETIS